MKAKILICFLAGASLLPLHAAFDVSWYKVAGGGGVSSGDTFSVSGTAGQQDASGALTGGHYSVSGGFWSFLAQPAIGAPLLTIQLTSTNTVLISWPSPSTGFILQQKSDLSGGPWTTAPEVPTDDGVTKSVVVNPPTGDVFYRLKN